MYSPKEPKLPKIKGHNWALERSDLEECNFLNPWYRLHFNSAEFFYVAKCSDCGITLLYNHTVWVARPTVPEKYFKYIKIPWYRRWCSIYNYELKLEDCLKIKMYEALG